MFYNDKKILQVVQVVEVEGSGDSSASGVSKPETSVTITPSKTQQTITPPSGTVFNEVNVEPIPSEYIIPAGTLSVTENGTHTVTEYASVEVNIEGQEDLSEVLASQDTAITNLENYVNSIPNSASQSGSFFNRTFANNTPEQISKVSALISYHNMTSAEVEETFGWKIGDTISYQLSTGENVEMRIIDFNHDDRSDGRGKAGISLDMTHCLSTQYPMNNEMVTLGGWGDSVLRNTTLPTIKATIPQEWLNVIKKVSKNYVAGNSSEATSYTTISDDLFLLSEIEIFGKVNYANNGSFEGWQYEYWNGDESPSEKFFKNGSWWQRSCYFHDSETYKGKFCQVSSDNSQGSAGVKASNDSNGVSFAFCI